MSRRPDRLGRRATRGPVYQITGARRGVRDDVNSRTRRYLISMGIRTVCFVLAVVSSGWVRWTLIAAAIVLPYLSVVFANSGRERIEGMADPHLVSDRRAIGGGSAAGTNDTNGNDRHDAHGHDGHDLANGD